MRKWKYKIQYPARSWILDSRSWILGIQDFESFWDLGTCLLCKAWQSKVTICVIFIATRKKLSIKYSTKKNGEVKSLAIEVHGWIAQCTSHSNSTIATSAFSICNNTLFFGTCETIGAVIDWLSGSQNNASQSFQIYYRATEHDIASTPHTCWRLVIWR